MKRIAFMLVAVAALAGGLAYMVPASEQADGEAGPDVRRQNPPPDTATGGWSRWHTKKATSTVRVPF